MTPSGRRVLLVEDRDSLRRVLGDTLRADGFDVLDVADGREALDALRRFRFAAVITDLRLPGADGHEVLAAARDVDPELPVVLMTAYGTVEDAVDAMKGGAVDFLSKPVDPDRLLHVLRRAMDRSRLVHENRVLRHALGETLDPPEIVGASAALESAIADLDKVAPTDATVLLLGESGTGKELFARALHHRSHRSRGPFVAINCAAIPDNLIESELFGHEKGAFTGADRARPGRMELADGGTLFLDEIGELGQALQAKLLRVLQEREFERVGGRRTVAVDVRVVSATHRDLDERVRSGSFRDDLFYRLAVVSIEIPPLRERGDDVVRLACRTLERVAREIGRDGLKFTDEAIDAIRRHPWPGNVRELQNAVERAVILAEGPKIEAQRLGLQKRSGEDGPDGRFDALAARLVDARRGDAGLDEVVEELRVSVERELIRRALEASAGNKTKAAERLRMNYKRLLSRIQALGVEPR